MAARTNYTYTNYHLPTTNTPPTPQTSSLPTAPNTSYTYHNSYTTSPAGAIDYTKHTYHTSMELRSRETGEWLHQDRVRAVQKFDDFITVDWMLEELEEHRSRLASKRKVSTLQQRTLQSTRTWLMLAAMGVTIGTIAASLNVVTAWLASLRVGHCLPNIYLSHGFCCWDQREDLCQDWHAWLRFAPLRYGAYVFILAVFSLAAAVLVKGYAPSAAGLGILEIKCTVSGFVMRGSLGFLGWWTLLVKSLGLPLAIASGLSLGKEGPSVHYAVCVGNCFLKLSEHYRQLALRARVFLTATAAAGVAVAFGLPMGGVLFAMEEIALVFQLLTLWKLYVCALIAVATLAAFNPFRTGQLVLFEVTYDLQWHFFELPFYALLGVFGGVYGIVVSRLNKRVAGFRKKFLASYAVREVVLLAVFLASFCYFNQFLRLDMTEVMQSLFSECLPTSEHEICDANAPRPTLVASLLFATVARLFLTIITYGCKVPAGIFVPSMAAGATFGRAVGILVEVLYEKFPDLSAFSTCSTQTRCVIPGTYAFIGAGAALSGITHLTVTVAIIMFELTGAVRYIIPTMVAVAVTKIINDKWGQGGIADQMIEFNGLPFIDSKEEFVFNTTVGAAMSTVSVVFTTDTTYTMGQIREILTASKFKGYPVVQSESEPRIVGYVTLDDLYNVLAGADEFELASFGKQASNAKDLSKIFDTAPLVMDMDTTLEYLLDVFARLGPRHVLIQKAGLLVGTITRKDILRYMHTTHEMHRPHVDDGCENAVWHEFQFIGERLRAWLTSIGLARVANYI